MIDPVAILKARKAKILADAQREAKAVDADLRELERLNAIAEKYGLTVVKSNGRAADHDEAADAEVAIDLDGPIYKAAISVSEQALKAARHPLDIGELYDACVEKGVKLGGDRPRSTLSAYLSSSHSTVQSIRKGVYWLKDVPVPS